MTWKGLTSLLLFLVLVQLRGDGSGEPGFLFCPLRLVQPKSSGSSGVPGLCPKLAYLASSLCRPSVCCQSDTRKWTRWCVCVCGVFFFPLPFKRGARLRDFSGTGEECFVILTRLVRGIASPGCVRPLPRCALASWRSHCSDCSSLPSSLH